SGLYSVGVFSYGQEVITGPGRCRRSGGCNSNAQGGILDLARQQNFQKARSLEAGGVEPPSEKRYGPKPTCLSHSICFAGYAWNAQDAWSASPINLAGKPRTEVRRPAYCVTPRSEPAGEARGDGLTRFF